MLGSFSAVSLAVVALVSGGVGVSNAAQNADAVQAEPGSLSIIGGSGATTYAATCVQPVTGRAVGCTQAATLWYNSKAYGYGSGTKFSRTTPVGSQLVSLAVSDFAGYTFQTPGEAGYGKPVKNNAAASTNNNGDSATYVNIWFNSGFKGAKDQIPPATTKDLVATKNENASLSISYYA